MEHSTVFQTNRSQAVRLPKAVALPSEVKQVDIVAVGRVRIITPTGESWDEWFEHASFSTDYMNERDQPPVQERETF